MSIARLEAHNGDLQTSYTLSEADNAGGDELELVPDGISVTSLLCAIKRRSWRLTTWPTGPTPVRTWVM
jgi:hypothetical protein